MGGWRDVLSCREVERKGGKDVGRKVGKWDAMGMMGREGRRGNKRGNGMIEGFWKDGNEEGWRGRWEEGGGGVK